MGGERGERKGRRSVYLSSAVPASDGGSRLTKGNVVNSDESEEVDGERKKKEGGGGGEERRSSSSGKSYVQERCLLC